MKKLSSMSRGQVQLRGNQINWNQIFYFSEIASLGSIKEAASRLDLSPSTLSEHVSQLEKDLRVQLFVRHHRKLSLTTEGARLFQFAKQMFEAGQRLVDVVSPVSLGCYPISVANVPTSLTPLGYRIIERYLQRFPQVDMRCKHASHDELERGLADAEFDFGFSDQQPERKDLVSSLIADAPLQFYVADSLAGKPVKELLERLPLLICNAYPKTRTPIERMLEELDIVPQSVVSSDFPGMVLDLCEQGCGVSVFSEAAIQKSARVQPLRMPRGAERIHERLYALWAKGSENSEVVKRLKELLAERA